MLSAFVSATVTLSSETILSITDMLKKASHAICFFYVHATAQMICLPLVAIVVVVTLHTSGLDTKYQRGPDSGHLHK